MNKIHEIAQEKRPNTKHILPEILYRWSPRVMSGQTITLEEIEPLFEAARWAPSSSNNQEWEYYFALRADNSFERVYALLDSGNQRWCSQAGALVVVVSNSISLHKNRFIRSHSFDTGASFQNLAIEGTRRGMVVHPMGGFDYEGAKELLKLSDSKQVEAMIAIGWPGPEEDLKIERKVTTRKPIEDFAKKIDKLL